MRPLNVVRRVSFRGGWIGVFTGESQGKALERVVPQLNADGYKVTFVVEDKWSVVKRFFSILLAIVTLGFVVPTPNVLIIGERVG